jgi:membrane-associated protease RseP (regulator of RpoE activity)
MELARYYESRRSRRRLTVVASMVAAGLTAWAVYEGIAPSPTASAGSENAAPAKIVPIGKTGLNRVVLTADAARRLDVHTAPVVRTLVHGARHVVIPYSAVLYDKNGDTWAYTSPKPLVFVRHDVRVAEVAGGHAVLASGLRPGMRVVSVGSAELWGVEYGEISED